MVWDGAAGVMSLEPVTALETPSEVDACSMATDSIDGHGSSAFAKWRVVDRMAHRCSRVPLMKTKARRGHDRAKFAQ